MKPKSSIALCAVAIGLLLSGCFPSHRPPPPSRHAEIARVREVLHLDYPYRIVKWAHYTDGGTLGAVVVDRSGRTLEFSLDGRLFPQELPRPGRDTIRVPHRHFFIGAQHPDRAEARELPIGGIEELAILDMLETIGLDHFGRTEEDIVLQAASLAYHRKRMDPRGRVIWPPPDAR